MEKMKEFLDLTAQYNALVERVVAGDMEGAQTALHAIYSDPQEVSALRELLPEFDHGDNASIGDLKLLIESDPTVAKPLSPDLAPRTPPAEPFGPAKIGRIDKISRY